MEEEKTVRLVDEHARQILFEISEGGILSCWVNGRLAVRHVKALHVEGRTLRPDGKRWWVPRCTVTVPEGQEKMVERVMELFGRRSQCSPIEGPACVVTIVSARGLRNEGTRGSDPYCTCELGRTPLATVRSSVRTRTIKNTLDPTWDHMAELTDYVSGDSLYFVVWHKKRVLGTAVLTIEDVGLPSYEGELQLNDAGKGIEAFLKVKVVGGTERERCKQHARRALITACELCSISQLTDAIALAKTAGLTESEYDEATHTLRKEEDKRRQKEQAQQDLREACVKRTSEALSRAIEHAKSVGLEDAEYIEASNLLTHLKQVESQKKLACEQLQKACECCTIDALKEAVEVATKAGLEEREYKKAKELMLQLQETERLKKDALERLEEACEIPTLQGLKNAIEFAREANLDESQCSAAVALLQEMEVKAEKAKARKTLAEAAQTRSIDALKEAIEAAKAANLSETEYSSVVELLRLEEARHLELIRLEEARQKARTKLEEACELCSIESLQKAIAFAEVNQLDDSECLLARNLLEKAMLEEEARLEKALQEEEALQKKNEAAKRRASIQKKVQQACITRKVDDLKRVIERAQAAGLDSTDYGDAVRSLESEQKKQEARQQLSDACTVGTVGVLKLAVDAARNAELHESEYAKAVKLILGQALKLGTIDALKEAIDIAKPVNIDLSEYSKVEACLHKEELKRDARIALGKAVERCRAGDPDVEKLRSSLKEAELAGLEREEYRTALQTLARELLQNASTTCTIEAATEAIDTAKEAELEECEYKFVLGMLTELKRQEQVRPALELMEQALNDGHEADVNDIDSVFEAKEALKKATSLARKLGATESEVQEAEAYLKVLHNKIQDFKGAIRVFCRVRPLSKKELDAGDKSVAQQLDVMTVQVEQERRALTGSSIEITKHPFNFDAVFTPGTQQEVFADCEELVRSIFAGHNITLFAYGQTGAGKTYTMAGDKGDPGISLRTIKAIYETIESRQSQYDHTVAGSILELYCNEIYDLLRKGTDPLHIRHDDGAAYIENLTEEICSSVKELHQLFKRGQKQRVVAETALNTNSSRSHLILIVKIVCVNKSTREQIRGKILICDLAGSERLKKSKSTGDREREAIEINKSLTALGDVIFALTQGQKVVPYRNHKLTQILQDTLGGTSKALMFVNCSPANSNVDETLMSLTFATRAKKITNAFKDKFLRCVNDPPRKSSDESDELDITTLKDVIESTSKKKTHKKKKKSLKAGSSQRIREAVITPDDTADKIAKFHPENHDGVYSPGILEAPISAASTVKPSFSKFGVSKLPPSPASPTYFSGSDWSEIEDGDSE